MTPTNETDVAETERLRPIGPGFDVPVPGDSRVSSLEMKNGRWRRWFARQMDTVLMTVAITIVFNDAVASGDISTLGLTILSVLLLIPIEAMALAEWGRTPGKALMGLRVVDETGRPPSIPISFKRASRVAAQGVALGLGVFATITMAIQYSRMGKGQEANYEVAGTHVVGDPEISTLKVAVAWLLGLGTLALALLPE